MKNRKKGSFSIEIVLISAAIIAIVAVAISITNRGASGSVEQTNQVITNVVGEKLPEKEPSDF